MSQCNQNEAEDDETGSHGMNPDNTKSEIDILSMNRETIAILLRGDCR